MEQDDLLRFAVAVLERLRIPYLVTGSMATVFFGEPRFTNDIDIVVDLPEDRVSDLCRAFPASEFYVDDEAARMAVRRRGQFNVIHPVSALKLDLMVAAATEFNRSRFARARRVKPAEDYEATFSSPEDVIVKKMEAYREGGSEKHLRDIAGVLRVSAEQIDRKYVEEWAGRLGLEDIWQGVLARLEGTGR
jgi:hypothetical protein